jgi:glycosyltransferase involved in cell wall biosynthesis
MSNPQQSHASAASPLVSVLTPVYNGGEYLRACIESVITQTYSNWRYTIVDNCSTDDTQQIAQHYAQLDPRIRVHTNRVFLPIIDNHSHAFSLIESDSAYCKPLMADDWMFPECLEKMVKCAVAHPSIGLVCTYALSGMTVKFQGITCLESPESFLPGRVACRRALLDDVYFFGSPTTMLIRSDLIRTRIPFYNPVNLHADEESCYDILQESDYGFVHQVLAYFRKHERSQTAQALDFDSSILAGRVYALAKYGRVYLSEEEFRRRSRERCRELYSALAKATLRLRDKKFSQHCRTELAVLGMSLDRWRLVRAVLWRVIVLLSNPGEFVKKLHIRVADRFAKRGSPRQDQNGWKRGQ